MSANRLYSTDYFGFAVLDGSSDYHYGWTDGVNRSVLSRRVVSTRAVQTVYTFPATGASIRGIVLIDSVTIVANVMNVPGSGGDGTSALWHIDISGGLEGSAVVTKAADLDGGAATQFQTLSSAAFSQGVSTLGTRTAMVTYYLLGGSVDLQIMLSTDSTGETFTEFQAIPTTIARHLHMCAWAPDGRLWVTVGDGDESAIIIIDMALTSGGVNLTGETDWDLLNAQPGFTVLSQDTTTHADRRWRTTGVVFKDGFAYWMTDQYEAAYSAVNGIWRIDYTSLADSTLERVDSQYQNINSGDVRRIGWVGAILSDQIVFTDYIGIVKDGSATPTSDFCNYLYCSSSGDAGSWVRTTAIFGEETADPDDFTNQVRSMITIDDQLFYAGVSMGGKGSSSGFDTATFKLSGRGAVWDSDDPTPYDHGHPVFWIDPDGGNNSNSGFDPTVGWLNTVPMGAGNECCWSSQVVLLGDVTMPNRLTPSWAGYFLREPALGPVQIVDTGYGRQYGLSHAAGSVYAIYEANANHDYILDGVSVLSTVANSSALYTVGTIEFNVYLWNCALAESTDFRGVRIGNNSNFFVFNSEIKANTSGASDTSAVQFYSTGGSLTGSGVTITGGWANIQVVNSGATIDISNFLLNDAGAARSIRLEGSATVVPLLTNGLFNTDFGGLNAINDIAGLTWNNGDVNTCWFRNDNDIPSFISALTNSTFSTSTPEFIDEPGGDFRIFTSSPLADAGTTVSGTHYDVKGMIFSPTFEIGLFVASTTGDLTFNLTSSLTFNLTG